MRRSDDSAVSYRGRVNKFRPRVIHIVPQAIITADFPSLHNLRGNEKLGTMADAGNDLPRRIPCRDKIQHLLVLTNIFKCPRATRKNEDVVRINRKIISSDMDGNLRARDAECLLTVFGRNDYLVSVFL